ncbi:hypothetical protein SUGI_0861730 [Cryptomeria japonica]|nr:hypothetical protein SUGI_0861730 [Cryptomeria japonica]
MVCKRCGFASGRGIAAGAVHVGGRVATDGEVLSLEDRSALRKVEVIELVEKCVRDATLDKNRLGEVILIGGLTPIPKL